MLMLVAGLVLFLGMHSASIVALDFRDRMAAASPIGWRVVYSLVSIAGIVLIVKGYADARGVGPVLYTSPVWLKQLASVLMLPVFVFFVAPYFSGRIQATLKHPQLVAVKLWATMHLLANGSVADLLLFGGFLAWGVVDRISMKRRVQRPLPGMPKSAMNDLLAVVIGLGLYVAFVLWLHGAWIGVSLRGYLGV
jgi:uncharacterized membrane protein